MEHGSEITYNCILFLCVLLAVVLAGLAQHFLRHGMYK